MVVRLDVWDLTVLYKFPSDIKPSLRNKRKEIDISKIEETKNSPPPPTKKKKKKKDKSYPHMLQGAAGLCRLFIPPVNGWSVLSRTIILANTIKVTLYRGTLICIAAYDSLSSLCMLKRIRFYIVGNVLLRTTDILTLRMH